MGRSRFCRFHNRGYAQPLGPKMTSAAHATTNDFLLPTASPSPSRDIAANGAASVLGAVRPETPVPQYVHVGNGVATGSRPFPIDSSAGITGPAILGSP